MGILLAQEHIVKIITQERLREKEHFAKSKENNDFREKQRRENVCLLEIR